VQTRTSSGTNDDGACGRRNLLGGVVSRDTVWAVDMVGLPSRLLRPVEMFSLCGGLRHGGCLPQTMTSTLLLVSKGLFSIVGFDRLQRSTAAGVAWHSPVRCGIASEDDACGNYN
jgi:hypothetical protein